MVPWMFDRCRLHSRPIASSSFSGCSAGIPCRSSLARSGFPAFSAPWLLTHSIYKIRICRQEHVPSRGPALARLQSPVTCRRLSGRRVRAAVHPLHGVPAVFETCRYAGSCCGHAGRSRWRRATGRTSLASIAQARAELRAGHVVCIFAEGGISRTGNLLPFKRGYERIVEGLDVPVIPVCLDRLWGSVFSFKQGRFFWKWPEHIPYPVSVSFGAPCPPPRRLPMRARRSRSCRATR